MPGGINPFRHEGFGVKNGPKQAELTVNAWREVTHRGRWH